MVEAKATARHDKLAKSKQQKLESLRMKLASERESLSKMKSDRKADIRYMPKEDRPAAKEKLAADVLEAKQKIAATKEEIASLKAEIKADKAKAKENA